MYKEVILAYVDCNTLTLEEVENLVNQLKKETGLGVIVVPSPKGSSPKIDTLIVNIPVKRNTVTVKGEEAGSVPTSI